MTPADWPDAAVAEMLAPLRRKHFVLDEDRWYTCPAATDERDGGHTCNDNPEGVCACGADAYNAKLGETAARIGRGIAAALGEAYSGGREAAASFYCGEGESRDGYGAAMSEALAAFKEAT